MKVLGIETSCDETSIGAVENGQELFTVVYSQKIHSKYGGVVPELASRQHLLKLHEMLYDVKKSNFVFDAVAVAYGPGLIGALLVGVTYAKTIAWLLGKKLVGINHLEGHIYSPFINRMEEMRFPLVALVVSGGHTELVFMKKEFQYEVVGRTRDDAAGEAFDKGAKLMGLGYPGGPLIDALAKKGDPNFHKFPRPTVSEPHYDFSFSGLKTSLLHFLRKHPEVPLENVAASYQEAIVETLVVKLLRLCEERKPHTVVVCGGVSANSRLREVLKERFKHHNLFIPENRFAVDNGTMIALAGERRIQAGYESNLFLEPVPALCL